MTSKAEKLKRKRGRPKKDGAREPNGRLQRTTDAYNESLETRMRQMFGMDVDTTNASKRKDAADPALQEVIGALRKCGELDKKQYDTLKRYIALRQRYKRAIASPDAYYEGNGTGTLTEDEIAELVNKVKMRWETVKSVIQEENCIHRNHNLSAALQYLVHDNEIHWHMVGDLRLAANALKKPLGLGD